MKTFNTVVFGLLIWFTTDAYAQENIRDSARQSSLVRLEMPATLPPVGSVVEAGVIVRDGIYDLASYALRLRFDPEVLEIEQIEGGPFVGFSHAPLSDSASFDQGLSDFTSVIRNATETPEEYQVALVRFRVVGAAVSGTSVTISNTPGGGMVEGKSFTLLDMRYGAPARMAAGR